MITTKYYCNMFSYTRSIHAIDRMLLVNNVFFIIINFIMVGAQIAIIFVGGAAFEIKPINGVQWAVCVVVALFCLPWAVLVRLFPDPLFARISKTVGGPFVVAYNFVAKGFSKFGRLFKSKKSATAPEDLNEKTSAVTTTSFPGIVVSEGASDVNVSPTNNNIEYPSINIQQPNDNPTIQIEDLERGRS